MRSGLKELTSSALCSILVEPTSGCNSVAGCREVFAGCCLVLAAAGSGGVKPLLHGSSQPISLDAPWLQDKNEDNTQQDSPTQVLILLCFFCWLAFGHWLAFSLVAVGPRLCSLWLSGCDSNMWCDCCGLLASCLSTWISRYEARTMMAAGIVMVPASAVMRTHAKCGGKVWHPCTL